MKKFLLVLLIVLIAISVLAACSSLLQTGHDVEQEVEQYTQKVGDAAQAAGTLPAWVLIVAAIAIFFIGFGLIWKLIPGFIKFIALIVLAIFIAGVAYGLWQSPLVSGAIDKVDSYMEEQQRED